LPSSTRLSFERSFYGTELPAPERVAHHHHAGTVLDVVLGGERATALGAHAEHLEHLVLHVGGKMLRGRRAR
jgi:hypothetical protein